MRHAPPRLVYFSEKQLLLLLQSSLICVVSIILIIEINFLMSESLFALLQRSDFPQDQYWTKREFSVNDTVFREGDISSTLYLVIEGELYVQGDIQSKEKATPSRVATITSGGIIGEFCLFDDMPRAFTVVAGNSCVLAEIDRTALLDYFSKHPDLGYSIVSELFTVVVKRLRKTNKRMQSLLAWGIKTRSV